MRDLPYQQLGDFLLKAMQLAAKHGGSNHVLISSVDSILFSGCVELSEVADHFMNIIQTIAHNSITSAECEEKKGQSDHFQKIEQAVRELSALSRKDGVV